MVMAAADVPLAMPLVPSTAARKAGVLSVKLVRGETTDTVLAPLFMISESTVATPISKLNASVASRVQTWIGGAGVSGLRWAAQRGGPEVGEAPGGPGVWVAIVPLPEGELPERLTADGREYLVRPVRAITRQEAAPRRTSWLDAELAQRGSNPLDRWRVRLAKGEPLVQSGAGAGDAFVDAAIEGLATQLELQWTEALMRVDAADAMLGAALRSTLRGRVEMDGQQAIIWPQPREELETLRRELLADDLTAQDRASIARAWLNGQENGGGAVVVDDAAAVNARNRTTYPAVLMVNLSPEPAAAWVGRIGERSGGQGAGARNDLQRIEGWSGRVVTMLGERRADEAATPNQRVALEATRERLSSDRIEVRVGEWSGRRAVVGELARIRPPGLTIGPMLSDWTERTLLSALAEPSEAAALQVADVQRGIVGRLYRTEDVQAAGGPAGGAQGGGWMLYLEVLTPGDAAKDTSRVTLHFGPPVEEVVMAVQLPLGEIEELRGAEFVNAGRTQLVRTVAGGGGRTAMWIPVPARAIEPGEILRLGIVRTDELGRRSAWPRPMLPWSDTPGRVAAYLGAWAPKNE